MSDTVQTGQTVYLVFKGVDGLPEFCGLFTDEEDAVRFCTSFVHCIAPAEVNKPLGEQSCEWPGCWYPMCQSKHELLEQKEVL